MAHLFRDAIGRTVSVYATTARAGSALSRLRKKSVIRVFLDMLLPIFSSIRDR